MGVWYVGIYTHTMHTSHERSQCWELRADTTQQQQWGTESATAAVADAAPAGTASGQQQQQQGGRDVASHFKQQQLLPAAQGAVQLGVTPAAAGRGGCQAAD